MTIFTHLSNQQNHPFKNCIFFILTEEGAFKYGALSNYLEIGTHFIQNYVKKKNKK